MVRRLSLILALLLVVAACTDNADPTTTTSGGDSTTTTPAGESTTTVDGDSPTTTSGAVTTTAPDLSGLEGVSDAVRDQIAGLMGDAQEIRELAFRETPTITVLEDDAFEARVVALLEEDTEDLPADEALYKLLGLLAEESDLQAILNELYGEQVAGFYDGETGEIVVRARQDELTLIEQGTMVHEMVHALTDQHISFHDTFQAMVDEDRFDQANAYQALIEGDATLAEVLWIQRLPQEQIGRLLAESLTLETPAFNSAPRFLTESLTFPYDSGLAFVQDLHGTGGWDAVNDAYVTMPDLPGSTEQIITPDDYTRDLPADVAIPDVPLAGYELEFTSVWGEQGFRLLLNQGEGVNTVAEASEGWGGDSYHQWFDGESAALLVVYQGDTSSDTNELEQALLGFAQQDFPEDNFVWVEQLDGNLYFIAADVMEVGEQIRSAVGLG